MSIRSTRHPSQNGVVDRALGLLLGWSLMGGSGALLFALSGPL